MRQLCYLIFCILTLLRTETACREGVSDEDKATLMVTYKTGSFGERLDRVRFLLKDGKDTLKIFPRQGRYLEDMQHLSRKVVIENLAPGDYTLEFLYPNKDGFFEEVPPRHIALTAGKIAKVEQDIRGRYASLQASTTGFADNAPSLLLVNKEGHCVAQSQQGLLTVDHLTPGRYKLLFGAMDGFITPDPLVVEALPGENIGPLIAHYQSIKGLPAADSDTATPPKPTWSIAAAGASGDDPLSQTIYDKPTGEIYLPKTGQRIYNYAPSYDLYRAILSVENSRVEAQWNLYSGPYLVYSGHGSIPFLDVNPDQPYYIKAEEIPGYKVTVYPQAFTPRVGERLNIRIAYQATQGRIAVQSTLPQDDVIRMEVIPNSANGMPLRTTLRSYKKKVDWSSSPMPTGSYTVHYEAPSYYLPPADAAIVVTEGRTVTLTPELVPGRKLQVDADTAAAAYVLTNTATKQSWRGSGASFTFEQLLPGKYTLAYEVAQGSSLLAPPEEQVVVPTDRDAQIVVSYTKLGNLVVRTNAPRVNVTFRELGGAKRSFTRTLTAGDNQIALPVGSYRLYFANLKGEALSTFGQYRPDPRDIAIDALNPALVEVTYPTSPTAEKASASPQQQGSARVVVSSPSDQASLRIQALTDGTQPQDNSDGTLYRGRQVELSLPAPGHYGINYLPIPNFTTPPPATITVNDGDDLLIDAGYQPSLEVVEVNGGPSLVGDPFNDGNVNDIPARRVWLDSFAIGKYEVTNQQYAAWLNNAVKTNAITYHRDGARRGLVTDSQGKILCRTMLAAPHAQILVTSRGDEVAFYPLVGKESYPVIEVSWYGADAFARAQGGRLPTEAQWETAAAIAAPRADAAGRPPIKYRFATGTDTISPLQANYRDEDTPLTNVRVLTTPVGFYNGENVLPLTTATPHQRRTLDSHSPAGAYDMSGNVWEWVYDWYADAATLGHLPANNPSGPPSGTKKVAKGGCYDSLQQGVRVAERLPLDPEHCDAFTGFRVAY